MKFVYDDDGNNVFMFDDDSNEPFTGDYTGKFNLKRFKIKEGDKFTGFFKDNHETYMQFCFEYDMQDHLYSNYSKEEINLLCNNGFKYYEDGLIFTGITKEIDGFDMVAFKDGVLNKEYICKDNILLKDGFLVDGMIKECLYENGKKFTGGRWENGTEKYYKDGKLFTGSYGTYHYKDGIENDGVIDGVLYDYGRVANNLTYEGILYINGLPYTGHHTGHGSYFYEGKRTNWFSYKWNKIWNKK